jgi:SAM-dependent methyltransferase
MADRRREDGEPSLRDWHNSLGWGDGTHSVAPFVPTPEDVVETMLKYADTGPDDILYDLGCGDGRILFMAVEKFDVTRAIGIELNQRMVKKIQNKIKENNLIDRVSVINNNFFEEDISKATVVTLYLTTSGNSKLRPKFEKELKPGTRIVSHDFPIQEWEDHQVKDSPFTFGSHKIYLYEIYDKIQSDDGWNPLAAKRWKRIRDRLIR